MRTLRIFLALLALALGVSTGRAQSFTVPTGSGAGSVTTGSVTVVSGSGIALNGTVLSLSSTLSNLNGTMALTNPASLTLHSNAVTYAVRVGLTNREAIGDISGFFWTLQNNGLLSAFHDAAFLRGGQNAETNIAVRFTYRGSNGTSYASPVQTDKGILTGSGGGGYNFPTEDLSTDFTLIFSGQTGAGGQTAYSHMISYTHATGSTNFGISIGHDVNNANVVVRSNNTTAVYAANYFGHLFTDYLRDDYPFPFTAGFGYQRSGILTNWHNGYLGTNSSGNHPLSGLTLITVGSRLDDASPGYAQSWTGTAHAWLLFNRQLSSNEVKQVEIALRWLAPTTHNEIAVGDSTSANIYTKQAESWSYQWFTGPGTNLGEYYIAAASGRSAVSMNDLWDDTVTRRKPQGKVKTATARIWAGINDIYAGGTGQATWEIVSNMTVKATRDGVGVEIATLYPSVAYDASMRVHWTNYNNQIISNANMFKKVYRRDLMFTVTNGVMWYDFLHLSTNGLAEVVKDMALGGAIGWGKVLPTYPVGAGAGKVMTSDANGVMTLETPSGGAQTPWAQDIDGAGNGLTNVGRIELSGTGESLNAWLAYDGGAFAVARRTNAPAGTGTSNHFEFSQSASVGQVPAIHSNTDGVLVWTNAASSSSGPTVLARSGLPTSVSNTISEITLFSETVSASSLGTNKMLELVMAGDLLNNANATNLTTFRWYFGGSLVYQGTTAGLSTAATRHGWEMVTRLVNLDAATNQSMTIDYRVGAAGTTVPAGNSGVLTAGGSSAYPNAGVAHVFFGFDTATNNVLTLTASNNAAVASFDTRKMFHNAIIK